MVFFLKPQYVHLCWICKIKGMVPCWKHWQNLWLEKLWWCFMTWGNTSLTPVLHASVWILLEQADTIWSPNPLLVNMHTKLVHEYFTPSFTNKNPNYAMTWLKGSKANTRSTNSLVHGNMNNKSWLRCLRRFKSNAANWALASPLFTLIYGNTSTSIIIGFLLPMMAFQGTQMLVFTPIQILCWVIGPCSALKAHSDL
jgi:hypothetical protein